MSGQVLIILNKQIVIQSTVKNLKKYKLIIKNIKNETI